jgi:hypothetical protein
MRTSTCVCQGVRMSCETWCVYMRVHQQGTPCADELCHKAEELTLYISMQDVDVHRLVRALTAEQLCLAIHTAWVTSGVTAATWAYQPGHFALCEWACSSWGFSVWGLWWGLGASEDEGVCFCPPMP